MEEQQLKMDYEKPELVELGKMEDLTLTGSGSGYETDGHYVVRSGAGFNG